MIIYPSISNYAKVGRLIIRLLNFNILRPFCTRAYFFLMAVVGASRKSVCGEGGVCNQL
jgi:hypothetical protein